MTNFVLKYGLNSSRKPATPQWGDPIQRSTGNRPCSGGQPPGYMAVTRGQATMTMPTTETAQVAVRSQGTPAR